jgi:hypothetical protein
MTILSFIIINYPRNREEGVRSGCSFKFPQISIASLTVNLGKIGKLGNLQAGYLIHLAYSHLRCSMYKT